MDQLSSTWLRLKGFFQWLYRFLCSANCFTLGFLQERSTYCSLPTMETVSFSAFIHIIYKRFLQRISQGKSLVALGLVCFTLFLMQFLISRNYSNIPTARTIKILIWKWPYNQTPNITGNYCAKLYGIHGCLIKTNRSAFNQADVVVFHHVDMYPSVTSLPIEKRPNQQIWVWMSMESPSHNKKIEKLNGIFNWTMSYRRDSDICTPYGKLMPNTDQRYTIPKKGSSLAAWVVSNYKKHHKRTSIVKNLQNYMTIDIYGKGNGKPLSRESLLGTISKYPFYLAFENAIHQDYITEKLWRNSFMAGSVPVVLGPPRSNYEMFVPPGSFIHVEDFPSTKELAEYLKRVAKNKTLYKQYFEWKKQFKVKLTDSRERFCEICKNYHTLPQKKVYHNLDEWMYG